MHFITRAESGENPRETFKCYVRCLLFIVLCTYLGTIYIKYNFSPYIISRCGPPAPCRPPAPETRGRRRRWRTRSPRPRLSEENIILYIYYIMIVHLRGYCALCALGTCSRPGPRVLPRQPAQHDGVTCHVSRVSPPPRASWECWGRTPAFPSSRRTRGWRPPRPRPPSC